MGLMDSLWWQCNDHFGGSNDGSWRRLTITIDHGLMKLSMMIPWLEVVRVGNREARKFLRWQWSAKLYHLFLETSMTQCGVSWLGFVASDVNDRLEVVACPAVAVINQTDSVKSAACCYCGTLMGLFRAVFHRWQRWTSMAHASLIHFGHQRRGWEWPTSVRNSHGISFLWQFLALFSLSPANHFFIFFDDGGDKLWLDSNRDLNIVSSASLSTQRLGCQRLVLVRKQPRNQLFTAIFYSVFTCQREITHLSGGSFVARRGAPPLLSSCLFLFFFNFFSKQRAPCLLHHWGIYRHLMEFLSSTVWSFKSDFLNLLSSSWLVLYLIAWNLHLPPLICSFFLSSSLDFGTIMDYFWWLAMRAWVRPGGSITWVWSHSSDKHLFH